MILKLRIWSLASFLKKKVITSFMILYRFINSITCLTKLLTNMHREKQEPSPFFLHVSNLSLLSNGAPIPGVCDQSFSAFIPSARWKEYCSKSTVNSLRCWKGKGNTRLFLVLPTKARPIGRKVIHEKDVSFGQGIILEAVRVRKINEMLRGYRGDETHA